MATKLTIPERFRAGIHKILRLDERTVREIRSALENAKEGTERTPSGTEVPQKPDALAASAMRSVADMNLAEFAQIAEALAGLYTARSMRDASLDDFVDSVFEAMQNIPEENLQIALVDQDTFKGKLRTLLGSGFFSVIAKAYDLATEGRTFCSARILTDLRPVFGSEIEDGPQAMVVLHNLKLTYHETGQRHQDFMLSLDSDDLRILRQAINRAEKKAETLRIAVKDVRLFGIPKE